MPVEERRPMMACESFGRSSMSGLFHLIPVPVLCLLEIRSTGGKSEESGETTCWKWSWISHAFDFQGFTREIYLSNALSMRFTKKTSINACQQSLEFFRYFSHLWLACVSKLKSCQSGGLIILGLFLIKTSINSSRIIFTNQRWHSREFLWYVPSMGITNRPLRLLDS